MLKEYQVSIMCDTREYRPVSAIVKHEEVNLLDQTARREVMRAGIRKICIKRGWSLLDLKRYHYNTTKVREYDKQKIAEENKKRYEEIKEQHYNDGTWKRPKKG